MDELSAQLDDASIKLPDGTRRVDFLPFPHTLQPDTTEFNAVLKITKHQPPTDLAKQVQTAAEVMGNQTTAFFVEASMKIDSLRVNAASLLIGTSTRKVMSVIKPADLPAEQLDIDMDLAKTLAEFAGTVDTLESFLDVKVKDMSQPQMEKLADFHSLVSDARTWHRFLVHQVTKQWDAGVDKVKDNLV